MWKIRLSQDCFISVIRCFAFPPANFICLTKEEPSHSLFWQVMPTMLGPQFWCPPASVCGLLSLALVRVNVIGASFLWSVDLETELSLTEQKVTARSEKLLC